MGRYINIYDRKQIIVKIAKTLLMLDCGLSNATFETPNHVFALYELKSFGHQIGKLNFFSCHLEKFQLSFGNFQLSNDWWLHFHH
jgi:hypothetical protein